MLAVLQRLKEKLENIPIKEFLKEAVEDNEKFILDLNREQLLEGKWANGEKIYPEYTETTKRIKKLKGQPFDKVTIKDKGDVHRKMGLDADLKGFDMFSTDHKVEELKAKYEKGGSLFGLTKPSKKQLKDEKLKEALQQKTRAYFKK